MPLAHTYHKKTSEVGDLLEKWKIFKQKVGLQQQDSTQPNGPSFICHWSGEKHMEKCENTQPRDRPTWYSQNWDIHMEFKSISELFRGETQKNKLNI